MLTELKSDFYGIEETLRNIDKAIASSGLSVGRLDVPGRSEIDKWYNRLDDLHKLGGHIRSDVEEMDRGFYNEVYPAAKFMADINPERDFKTPNTLGIRNFDGVNGGNAMSIPSTLNLGHFLGIDPVDIITGKVAQVESFADLFKTLYEYSLENLGIDPDTSYNDFIKTIIPQPYSLPKDLTWWEKFGSAFCRALGISQVYGLITGKDMITGAPLTDAEKSAFLWDMIIRVGLTVATLGFSAYSGGLEYAARVAAQMLLSQLASATVMGIGSAEGWPAWATVGLSILAGLLVAFGLQDWVKEAYRPPIKDINYNDLPPDAQDAYNKYNQNGWQGNVSGQTPGTKAGKIYENDNGFLPSADASGNPITYREFDVHNFDPLVGSRDAYRFVIGSDGSIYYTNDHYLTFFRISK